MAADEKNPGEKKKSSSSSNIDLFAAGERKILKPPAPVVNTIVTPVTEKAVSSTQSPTSTVVPTSVPASSSSSSTSSTVLNDIVIPSSPISVAPSASRNSLIELQAELLRLEAEREQLEIDQQRLDEEKVSKGKEKELKKYLTYLIDCILFQRI